MALQTGLGFSKILILLGAGFTGSIVMLNGRLSDMLGEVQTLVKNLEKSGDSSNNNSDYSDALAAQDYANAGVWYLCNFVVGGKDEKMVDFPKALPKPSGKSRGLLGIAETASVKGLKQIADTMGEIDQSTAKAFIQNDANKMDNFPRSLIRLNEQRRRISLPSLINPSPLTPESKLPLSTYVDVNMS